MRLLSIIKTAIVPKGRSPRKIVSGPFNGIVMNLDLTTQFQFYIGTFERETQKWIRRLSQGIKSAVDIGAADGEYSLYFLSRTNSSKVYAFEPMSECRERIAHNLRNNHLTDVARFSLSDKMVGAKDNEQSCTLDSLLSRLDFPCFVKMDVDGGETEILTGAASLLRKENVRWLIETHSKALERDCMRILQDSGYTTRMVPNAWWRCIIPEHRPTEHNRWLVAARPGDISLH